MSEDKLGLQPRLFIFSGESDLRDVSYLISSSSPDCIPVFSSPPEFYYCCLYEQKQCFRLGYFPTHETASHLSLLQKQKQFKRSDTLKTVKN